MTAERLRVVLADDHSVVRDGLRFLSRSGPQAVIDAAVNAMRTGRNQYPPGHGAPELLDAVIEHQRTRYGLDWGRENVVITTGATEAIAGAAPEPFNFRAGLRVQTLVETIQTSSREGRWLAVA